MVNNHKKLSGITLVELLVSMVITLIIMGGVISVVLSSRSAFTTEQEASFIQENARYAVEVLSRDIRLAGSYGCVDFNNVKLANKVAVTEDEGEDDVQGLFALDAVTGFNSETGYPPELSAANGSDAVILRYGNPESFVTTIDEPVPPAGEGGSSETFTLAETGSFESGQHLVIVDASCRYMGFFVNASGSESNTVSAVTPTSCEIDLFPRENLQECDDGTVSAGASTNLARFSGGSSILEFVAHGYFVGESVTVPGVSALKRVSLAPTNEGGFRTDELAQGVESLEILYGFDRDARRGSPIGLGDVDAYLRADQIPVEDWWRVAAVRFNIVFKSQSQVFETAQEVTLNGQIYSDRYLRQIAASTVQIRNR